MVFRIKRQAAGGLLIAAKLMLVFIITLFAVAPKIMEESIFAVCILSRIIFFKACRMGFHFRAHFQIISEIDYPFLAQKNRVWQGKNVFIEKILLPISKRVIHSPPRSSNWAHRSNIWWFLKSTLRERCHPRQGLDGFGHRRHFLAKDLTYLVTDAISLSRIRRI